LWIVNLLGEKTSNFALFPYAKFAEHGFQNIGGGNLAGWKNTYPNLPGGWAAKEFGKSGCGNSFTFGSTRS
jgi:hypothetical protein